MEAKGEKSKFWVKSCGRQMAGTLWKRRQSLAAVLTKTTTARVADWDFLDRVKSSAPLGPYCHPDLFSPPPFPCLFAPYEVDVISSSPPGGGFQKPPITSAPLNPSRWDNHSGKSGGDGGTSKKREGHPHFITENKSTFLEVRGCGADMRRWIIQGGLKVPVWKNRFYFYALRFIGGREMAPVRTVWAHGAKECEGCREEARGNWFMWRSNVKGSNDGGEWR